MTTKILTIRVPAHLYSSLCDVAGELGVPVAAHVRRIVEREYDANQIENLRQELLSRIDALGAIQVGPATSNNELLFLCRAIATHLQPQLVAQVRAKLAQQ